MTALTPLGTEESHAPNPPPLRPLTRAAANLVTAIALIAAACGSEGEPTLPAIDAAPKPTLPAIDAAPEPTLPAEQSESERPVESAATTTPAAEEPGPEPVHIPPTLVVDPVIVSVGLNTFTLDGAGFDPALTTWTLLCPLGTDLSEDTPDDELATAMASVSEDDCDLETAREADIAADGTFSVQRDVMVNPQNFMVVAADADQTQVAAAAVFVSTEQPEQVTTAVPSATEPVEDDPEPEDEPTPTTSTAPDASVVDPEAAEPEPEPTVTTAPPEPEPEPAGAAPTLVVSPDVVGEGLNTFTIEGTGFDPGLATWTLLCALDSSLTEDTPTEQVEAAVAAVERSDCDMASAQAVDMNPDGTFTDTRDVIVRANFIWVASDIDETQTATAAVIMSQWPLGPPGTVVNISKILPDDNYPPDFVCEVQANGWVVADDGSQNCWDISDAQVSEWYRWCSQQETDAMLRQAETCNGFLDYMSQALDYLGADTQCVLDAYTQRVDYWVKEGYSGSAWTASNNYGWHLCATVIDPIVGDSGLKLSDTPGITLAERCRRVLVSEHPDIGLENGVFNTGDEPERFGQDCDAWAAAMMWWSDWPRMPDCLGSVHLSEEWMEHVHGQDEDYWRINVC